MSLDLFDDVFLLDFALEAAQGVLKRFPFLKSYFRQISKHPHFRVRLYDDTYRLGDAIVTDLKWGSQGRYWQGWRAPGWRAA